MKFLIKPHKTQLLVEEVVNATTHGIGALLSISALTALLIYAAQQGSPVKIISALLFGLTLFLMYSASTLYHSTQHETLKRWFKLFDHCAIYLLIAGSYTPFALITLNGWVGWTLFSVIWAMALIGICCKLFFMYRFLFVSPFIYLSMGWCAIFAIKPIAHNLPLAGLYWIVLGGLCYTIGVIFYLWKRLLFSHAIWHVFVLSGSLCHFIAILQYVIRT